MGLALCLLLAALQAAPAFDAASVKPVVPHGNTLTLIWRVDPSHLELRANPLRSYLLWAFGLKPYQIEAPSWINSADYDIVASYAPADSATVRLMLQKLLKDRFDLRFHFAQRPTDVYQLTTVAGPLKLQPAPAANTPPLDDRFGHITAFHASLAQLADDLGGHVVRRPVLDATGLAGTYAFTLDFRDPRAPASADAPSIFTALPTQLGLRLVPAKRDMRVLVVDHIARPRPND